MNGHGEVVHMDFFRPQVIDPYLRICTNITPAEIQSQLKYGVYIELAINLSMYLEHHDKTLTWGTAYSYSICN